MWEVFTEGKMPFENKSNLQVVEAISKGFRLYRPHLAPMSIYGVMYSCWHEVGGPDYCDCDCVMAARTPVPRVRAPVLMKLPPQSHEAILVFTMDFSSGELISLISLRSVLAAAGCF